MLWSHLKPRTTHGARRMLGNPSAVDANCTAPLPRHPVPFPDASCLPSRRDPWTGATSPGPWCAQTPTGPRHNWGVQRGGRSRPRPSGPSCRGRSGRGAARRGRLTAWGGLRVRMSRGARCASVLCDVCAVQCGCSRASVIGSADPEAHVDCPMPGPEAHGLTSPASDHAKHIRVLAVGGSPGAAATTTPRVSAAFPVSDHVLTGLRSRLPRSGERIP